MKLNYTIKSKKKKNHELRKVFIIYNFDKIWSSGASNLGKEGV